MTSSPPTQLFTRLAKRYVSDTKTPNPSKTRRRRSKAGLQLLRRTPRVHSLERRLVYRLKDSEKRLLFKASLESVTIDQDRIVVTFSTWQCTLSVLFGLLCQIAPSVVTLRILIPDSLLGVAFIGLLVRRNGDR